MSAIKHGVFRAGFMLCDRYVLNTRCERFTAGGECVKEKEAYDWTVRELKVQYGLEGLADEILAGRVAMYLIRIVRAENYESAIGVTDKSALWGRYIARLDNTLRGLMNDLAVTRVKRKQLDKEEKLMVSLDRLLNTLARKRKERKRRIVTKRRPKRTLSPFMVLLREWRRESKDLRMKLQGRGALEEAGDP